MSKIPFYNVFEVHKAILKNCDQGLIFMKIIFPIKFAIKNPEEVLGLVNRILMLIVLPLWSKIFSVKFKFVKNPINF